MKDMKKWIIIWGMMWLTCSYLWAQQPNILRNSEVGKQDCTEWVETRLANMTLIRHKTVKTFRMQ